MIRAHVACAGTAQRAKKDLGRRFVSGERDVVQIAGPRQGHKERIVVLGEATHRDDGMNRATDDTRSDLNGAATRNRPHAVDDQSELLDQHPADLVRGNNVARRKDATVCARQPEQLRFAFGGGNEPDLRPTLNTSRIDRLNGSHGANGRRHIYPARAAHVNGV